jgi:hypothetical protein
MKPYGFRESGFVGWAEEGGKLNLRWFNFKTHPNNASQRRTDRSMKRRARANGKRACRD